MVPCEKKLSIWSPNKCLRASSRSILIDAVIKVVCWHNYLTHGIPIICYMGFEIRNRKFLNELKIVLILKGPYSSKGEKCSEKWEAGRGICDLGFSAIRSEIVLRKCDWDCRTLYFRSKVRYICLSLATLLLHYVHLTILGFIDWYAFFFGIGVMLWFRVLFLYVFVVSMCLFSNAVGSVVV